MSRVGNAHKKYKIRQLYFMTKKTCFSSIVFNDNYKNKLAEKMTSTIGIIEGEGIGPDLLKASLTVLGAIKTITSHCFDIQYSNYVGFEQNKGFKYPLDSKLIEFCNKIFSLNGAILAGPGGGRFVYNLRREFDLFCKLNPVKPCALLSNISRIKADFLKNIDIIIVRENISGLYFGKTNYLEKTPENECLEYTFSYSSAEVNRIIKIAAKIASVRQGKLMIVTKEGGIPEISKLWHQCAEKIAMEEGIKYTIANIDYAAYYLIQHAQELDVIVAPNLFGDVLVDVSALLLGSRSLSYSANYSAQGASVYQTNHGAAFDLVGKNLANPIAQISSLAMMLRENFGLAQESFLIEQAIRNVWLEGWRTIDVMESGCNQIGTQEMATRIADAVIQLATKNN
jgi:3-isopropylmalate dehydrogenase